MNKNLIALPLFLVILLFAGPVSARSGDLDPTFGMGGKVLTHIGACANFSTIDVSVRDTANAMALQSDGKIAVAGRSCGFLSPTLGIADPTVARYGPDGDLDRTFGGGWRTADGFLPPPMPARLSGGFNDIAIQDDGKGEKIVVDGTINGDTFALARFQPNGLLDSSFDDDGRLVTDFEAPFSPAYFRATALAIQRDNKILAGGTSSYPDPDHPPFYTNDVILARYNLDGTLDSTFGEDGKIITDFETPEGIADIVIQEDGKIVAAGSGNARLGRRSADERLHWIDVDFLVVRYNPDGTLDTSFGEGGKTTTDFWNLEWIQAITLQPDGKIVAAGLSGHSTSSYVGDSSMVVARYNNDGGLDPTFDGDGKLILTWGGHDDAQTVAVQGDGKILIGGIHNDLPIPRSGRDRSVSADDDFILIRLNPDGSLDEYFGTGGMVTTDFHGLRDGIMDMVFQGTHKIVVAGYATAADGKRGFALARYLLSDDEADLSITQSAEPSVATPGSTLIFHLTISNAGPDKAEGVRVTDSLPSYVTFRSARTASGRCEATSGFVTCNLDALESGGRATIDLVVVLRERARIPIMKNPPWMRFIVNTARVTGEAWDPRPDNNRSESRVYLR